MKGPLAPSSFQGPIEGAKEWEAAARYLHFGGVGALTLVQMLS